MNLQSLNCKQSKPLKCLNIKIPYSFLFKRNFREYLLSKVLIYQEKTNLKEEIKQKLKLHDGRQCLNKGKVS